MLCTSAKDDEVTHAYAGKTFKLLLNEVRDVYRAYLKLRIETTV